MALTSWERPVFWVDADMYLMSVRKSCRVASPQRTPHTKTQTSFACTTTAARGIGRALASRSGRTFSLQSQTQVRVQLDVLSYSASFDGCQSHSKCGDELTITAPCTQRLLLI